MKQRGRKSADAIATLTQIADLRPPPPSDLPEPAQKLWREIVGTRPSDWFRPDTFPLLASYCRHCWHAAEIDRLIEKAFAEFEGEERNAIPLLLKARERESRAMLALARSMRITQQAQYEPRTAARQALPSTRKPWIREDVQ